MSLVGDFVIGGARMKNNSIKASAGKRSASNSKFGVRSTTKSNRRDIIQPPDATDPPPMSRKDYAFLFILIAVYSVIAFARLGDLRAPQTAWVSEESQVVVIDFGNIYQVAGLQYRMSASHEQSLIISSSSDGITWHNVIDPFTNEILDIFTQFTGVFAWSSVPLNFEARYVQVHAVHEGIRLQEIAFHGPDRELLPIYAISPGDEALVDEQHLVPFYRSFMNSAYFDEVYHPRAGYEKLNGLRVWENTHPPMGKNIIALSMRIFGVTPFGWRFPGTLVGVLMVPLIYAFARLLFKSNNWALFATALFTFDFMHFAQTRLATIDSYVTFFIIAMYFLMYMFLHGIENDSFRKKMVILALCGISVGFAIASKWQGIYAVLGLPILFFPALYKLYLRDRRQATTIFYSCFGFFVAIPIAIYLLAYIPYVATYGGDVGFLRTVWNNQTNMYFYHSRLETDYHTFSSYWWEWPFNLRPLWIYANMNVVDNARGSIATFGNPAVWWAGAAAMFYGATYLIRRYVFGKKGNKSEFGHPAIWLVVLVALIFFMSYMVTIPASVGSAAATLASLLVVVLAVFFILLYTVSSEGRDRDLAFLFVAFGAQFFPWTMITRLTWIYHYFPSVPFVVLIAVWVFKYCVRSRKIAIGYTVVTVALFALFYPVLSGMAIDMDYVRSFLEWLPRWHLI